jgi:ABC-type dipeptide/oligopeptide/nickel transport system permease subunit
MQIDDKSVETTDTPKRVEMFSTGLGVPPMPPTTANIKDIGPFGDSATAAPSVQAQLALQVEGISDEKPISPFRASLRRFARDRRAMISLSIVVIIFVASIIGPFIYLHIGPTIKGGFSSNVLEGPEIYHNYIHQELLRSDQPPSLAYPLGTDRLGRDILARLLAGVNVSVQVAFLVLLFDIGLGLIVGTLAGYYGGVIDTFLARFTDLVFAFPALLFAIVAAATLGTEFTDRLGPSGRLILVSLALGITIWPQMARYVRGQTLQLKEQQFIEASRTVGTSDGGIIMRHIVPNLFSIVLTAATLDIVGIIIGEATISLLGLGVQPPGSSLGLMISEAAPMIPIAFHETLFPVLTLAIIVLCMSFVGDGIGDAFNPRRKD